MEDRFIAESEKRIDTIQMCGYAFQVSFRWIYLRLNVLGSVIFFFSALFSVLGRDKLSKGVVGLALNYASQVNSLASNFITFS